jgi:hypothetical protein
MRTNWKKYFPRSCRIAHWELLAEKQQIAEELQANALPQLQQRRSRTFSLFVDILGFRV